MDQDLYRNRLAEISLPLEPGIPPTGLLGALKDKRIVLLGESSHGSHEFYEWRNLMTRELLEHHGFSFVAVEADWAPCQQLNQTLKTSPPREVRRSLEYLDRWPTWMWGNEETENFLNWFQRFNLGLRPEARKGFHGLDLYSLFDSVDAVVNDLSTFDEIAFTQALKAYSCFRPYHKDEVSYVRSLMHLAESGCREELLELSRNLEALCYPSKEKELNIRMNARVVVSAERYFSAMVNADDQSWNLRESHMLEALSALLSHYGDDSKVVVWLHNSHVSGHRALKRREPQRLRLGGLARERFGPENVYLVGLSTYKGMVLASNAWEGSMMELPVPLGRRGSLEEVFHEACAIIGRRAYFVRLTDEAPTSPLREELGHRLIGAVYHPGLESKNSYLPVSLAQQFDAFLFVDETSPVSPLEINCDRCKIPETYPFNDKL